VFGVQELNYNLVKNKTYAPDVTSATKTTTFIHGDSIFPSTFTSSARIAQSPSRANYRGEFLLNLHSSGIFKNGKVNQIDFENRSI
jgi:hypothetical protein